jgi:hypothetical protein
MMIVNLSPLEIDFLLRELQANQGMIAPSASIPAWYRHSIQETLRDALLADRKERWALSDKRHKELLHAEAQGVVREYSRQAEANQERLRGVHAQAGVEGGTDRQGVSGQRQDSQT